MKIPYLNKIPAKWLALALILILGLSLRLVDLGTEPFWGDEILSLSITNHYQDNALGLIHYLREIEIHPPLYYLFLSLLSKLFVLNEFSARALSVAFGLGVIFLVFKAGRLIFKSEKIGLIAALLVAILPIQIEYSQEARPYIIFTFFALLSLIFLWQYFELKRKKYLLYFIFSSLLGLYLHYSFILILVSLFIVWTLKVFIEKKINQEYISILTTGSLIFLGFYWWLSAFLYKIVLSDQVLLGISRTGTTLRPANFIESTLGQLIWLTKNKTLIPLEILTILIFKITALVLFLFLIIKKPNKLMEIKKPFIFLGFAGILILVLFMFSPFSVSYTTIYEKHIIFVSLILMLLLAWLIGSLERKFSLLLLALFAVSLLNFDIKIISDDSYSDPLFKIRDIAQYINNNYKKDDIVIDNFTFDRVNMNYYLDQRIESYGFYPVELIDWRKDYLASRDTLGFLENEAQFRSKSVNYQEAALKMKYIINNSKANRVWLIYGGLPGYDYGAKNWLSDNGWRQAMFAIGDQFPVDLFVKNGIQK